MAEISFLGLGNMGLPMATHLLRLGHRLRVYNRTASRAAPLVAAGALSCPTPRQACEQATMVFSMVADDSASRSVWCGPDGALAATMEAEAIAVECSTLSHAWVMSLAAQCRARGMRYIDAPVTGLPDAAEAGKLTLLIGAEEADLRAIRPLLESMSAHIVRFGLVGTGTAYKLIINLLGAVQIASAAESFALAEHAGLDMSAVAAAMARSQAASPQVTRNVARMLAADHDQNIVFSSALRKKDVDYGLQYAQELGMSAPFGSVAGNIYRDLCAHGRAQANESSVIEILRANRPKSLDL